MNTVALGLRLPRTAVPTECWGAWTVVERANGFHVSRESANGSRTEALLNDVGRTRIFRKRPLAEKACAEANFTAGCVALKASGLLSPSAEKAVA